MRPSAGADPEPELGPLIITRSNRKTLVLDVRRDGAVLAKAPLRLSESEIRRFAAVSADRLRERLRHIRETVPDSELLSEEAVRALAQQARTAIAERVRYYAPLVGVTYGRITIRNQRSRWGSCSSKGNLNFNCLLMLAPPEVLDYVVVHELCHRLELNHSPRFYGEVQRVLPDYRERERWLKENGNTLIRRMTG